MDNCVHLEAAKLLDGPQGTYSATLKFLDLAGGVSEAHSNLCMDLDANVSAAKLAGRLSALQASKGAALYIIGPKNLDVVKIGYAADPVKRLGELQVGNWHDLVIHALIWADLGVGRIEKVAHKAAAEMGASLRGEWVALSPSEAIELALKAARYAKVHCSDSAAWMANWSEKLDALAVSRGATDKLMA